MQPLAPQRFAIQVTVGQATHDKLRRAQDLLGHRVPSGDLEQVLDRALDALIRQLEHAKFVSDSGRRCDERRDLEFDHLEPFARGGEATVSGVRLLCSAHNQLEAERIYGAGFMERKRGEARPDPAETRTARPSPALAPRRQPPQSPPTSAGARCT